MADKILLTVDNFISRIKEMDERERKKLCLQEIIELILMLPEDLINSDGKFNSMGATINNLAASVEIIRSQSIQNTAEILKVNNSNHELTLENTKLASDLAIFKENQNLDNREGEIMEIKRHLNGIDQYLRVNNLVVGLPVASIDEPEEDVLISALNSLAGLEKEIKIEDIDISHPIPTKRQDNKRVVVVKFVSRMTKFDVLSAKKQNRNFKYKGNDIFINEYLSPINRTLFTHAAERKKVLGF